MIKLLQYNAIILLNLAVFLKAPIVFIGSLLFLTFDHFLTKKYTTRNTVDLVEFEKLKNEINLIKTQIAFKKL